MQSPLNPTHVSTTAASPDRRGLHERIGPAGHWPCGPPCADSVRGSHDEEPTGRV
jgi:hypothetical protein